ncbi:TPA: FRG domain-containing protein [Clostridium perfringens]|nr:FRG domain-containing protein [Clostridium perfringens]HBI6891564.1 FRG domain-containing protein [Clostridium perfringens]HBI6900370.1 FRG domain-containing protein [Clostridium perfringens]HBI6906592.1 FRG domain-containing protein [Clostridium perfringens]HBI6924469.1 FRG domain-containing protein [Clostridium perfringens]
MICEEDCLVEINSFEEYIKFIKDYHKKNECEIWYRGQKSNKFDLKPNLYRDAKMNIQPNGEIGKLDYDFVNFKDEFIKLKKEIVDKKLFDISELNDFQVMFIAQHYGLLTPILDWTTDPLVALFFALDGYELKEDKDIKSDEFSDDYNFPVIYILKPGICNEFSGLINSDKSDIKVPICIDNQGNIFESWIENLNDTPATYMPIAIFSNRDFSHRICRQSGKFTFHGAVSPLSYEWNDMRIKDEKLVKSIKINPKSVNEIKEYMLALDITKKSIYRGVSDLDSICNQLKEEELIKFKEKIAESNKALV